MLPRRCTRRNCIIHYLAVICPRTLAGQSAYAGVATARRGHLSSEPQTLGISPLHDDEVRLDGYPSGYPGLARGGREPADGTL